MKEVETAIREYYDIKTHFDLLVHLYEKWDKTFFSGLCRRLAEGAAKGDALCKQLFEDAGKELAQHLVSELVALPCKVLVIVLFATEVPA